MISSSHPETINRKEDYIANNTSVKQLNLTVYFHSVNVFSQL